MDEVLSYTGPHKGIPGLGTRTDSAFLFSTRHKTTKELLFVFSFNSNNKKLNDPFFITGEIRNESKSARTSDEWRISCGFHQSGAPRFGASSSATGGRVPCY